LDALGRFTALREVISTQFDQATPCLRRDRPAITMRTPMRGKRWHRDDDRVTFVGVLWIVIMTWIRYIGIEVAC
jgi:hypothetical protein